MSSTGAGWRSKEWFTTRHLKWDLYVPFVQQYQRLLSDDKDARCVPHHHRVARELRPTPRSCGRCWPTPVPSIHDLFFADKHGLFKDASWQDNVVFCFSRGAPPGLISTIERQIARKRGSDESLILEQLDVVAQAPRMFNTRAEVKLNLEDTVRLDEICYVTVGMVLNSDEKDKEGAVVDVASLYDPKAFGEELVEDCGEKGKRIRRKAFGRDDLVSRGQDSIHTRRYVDSGEVLRGGIGRTQWLEYGPHTRCPSRVRRPTFPELYARPEDCLWNVHGDRRRRRRKRRLSDELRLGSPPEIRWQELDGVPARGLKDTPQELTNDKRYDA